MPAAPSKAIPTAILVVSYLCAALAFLVAAYLYFSPADVLENVNLKARGITYLTQMWAARQATLGVLFVYAAGRKSVSLLTAAWLFFGVMNLFDAAIGIERHDSGLTSGAVVMFAIAGVVLFFLRRAGRVLPADRSA